MPLDALVTDDYENDLMFELFDCEGSSDYDFTCYKFQPEIGNAVDGLPRFDPDQNNTLGITYDISRNTDFRFNITNLTLTHATMEYSGPTIGFFSALWIILFG